MSDSIGITGKLTVEQRPALERLLFFNLNQHRMRLGIEQSIARYGAPEILERDGCLRVGVGAIEGVQTLFAVSPVGRPVGVAVFARPDPERFVILHVGVEAPSGSAVDNNTRVLLKLLHEVRRAARRTRGVLHIEVVYKSGPPVRLHS